MEVARIRVSRTSITVLERNTIPAGLIGGTITIEYADASWGDLKKTVVFKGTVTKDVVTDDSSVRIPGEVLAESGKKLYVGVYGTDVNTNRAIPTLYADLGKIMPAADPFDDPTTDDGLPVWSTLQKSIEEINDELLDVAKKDWAEDKFQPKGDYATNEQLNSVEKKADDANSKVDTLREVVSKFHSNIQETVKGEVITVSDASDLPLAGLKVFGRTEQNGIPTPEAPVPLESVGDSVNVTVCGKNRINLVPKVSKTNQGVEFSASEDGTGTRLKGTSTGQWAQNSSDNYYPIELPEGMYTLSVVCDGTYSGDVGVNIKINGANTSGATYNRPHSFEIIDGNTYHCYVYAQNSDVTFDCVVRAMLVPGGTAAEWESYKGNTLPISTPVDSSGNSLLLPGIPVESGGNYTDPVTGKQWICDEVDFEKGVYVQRLTKLVFTGAETFTTSSDGTVYMYEVGAYTGDNGFSNDGSCDFRTWNTEQQMECSHFGVPQKYLASSERDFGTVCIFPSNGKVQLGFKLSGKTMQEYAAEQYASGNPVTIYYPRKEFKEFVLSPEQLAAYAAMHSNYPNTTVFNDRDAGMEVKYVADTKLYIDRKFNELAAALVSKV